MSGHIIRSDSGSEIIQHFNHMISGKYSVQFSASASATNEPHNTRITSRNLKLGGGYMKLLGLCKHA